MMRSVYTAGNGLNTLQKRMDNIANNLANVNTVGFKTNRMDFKDMMYQSIYREGVWNPANNLQMGSGTAVGGIITYMQQGKILAGDTQDVAIEGQGFFAVQDPSGQILYTRDGTFQTDNEGNLVNGQGDFVLDVNGNRIRIGTSQYDIDKNGNVLLKDGTQIATIGMFNCAVPGAMYSMGGNYYTPSENSGPMENITGDGSYVLHQGYYEGSNVDLATEFTYMIRTQRAMTMVSRALQTADEMDAKANNMRG